ncbi:MAG TPA: hypothetical protein VNM66_08735 [Thermodesulfobacteriota bacterium]|nr:hypothetical protein [Thermodesulfobacteriota bacterium]
MGEVRRVGSLEVAQDLAVTRRLWTLQRIGWGAMALVVAAALLGLFGSGPLSRAAAGDERSLRVTYERFARREAATELTLRVAAGAPERVRVWFDRSYLDRFAVEAIAPRPESEDQGPERVVYVFRVGAAEAPVAVTFGLRPRRAGLAHARVGVVAGPSLAFRQFVYP